MRRINDRKPLRQKSNTEQLNLFQHEDNDKARRPVKLLYFYFLRMNLKDFHADMNLYHAKLISGHKDATTANSNSILDRYSYIKAEILAQLALNPTHAIKGGRTRKASQWKFFKVYCINRKNKEEGGNGMLMIVAQDDEEQFEPPF